MRPENKKTCLTPVMILILILSCMVSAGQASVVSDNLFQTPFTLVTDDQRTLPTLNELRIGLLRSLGGMAETIHQLYPEVPSSRTIRWTTALKPSVLTRLTR